MLKLTVSKKQAAQLRGKLSSFFDWNHPTMNIYDDYDVNRAKLYRKNNYSYATSEGIETKQN
jgi:hypothetical protein